MNANEKHSRIPLKLCSLPDFLLAVAIFFVLQTTRIHADTNVIAPAGSVSTTNSIKRYIVALRKEADQDRCANDHKITRSRTFKHALNGFVANLDDATLAKLKNDSRVADVMEDKIAASNNSQVIPTGVRRMAVDNFPPVKIDGTDKRVNVDVAVIDSGIQADHPDLNVVQSVVFGYGELVDPSDPHGTECAGIIGALDNNFGVVGIVPGARLWSIRASSGGRYYFSDIFDAFNYVAAHANQIAVVSCSFGSNYGNIANGRDYFWRPAIAACVNQGVVVVAAAGNSAGDIAGPDGVLDSNQDDEILPAALAEVMAVSSVDPVTDQFAYYSNFSRTRHTVSYVNSPGAAIDVAAPGQNITTTVSGSGYVLFYSGTSAACPHAAGLVALYISTHGRATNAAGVYAIRQAIVDSAIPQSQWHSADTRDPDANHEGLAVASLSWATNAPHLLNVVKAVSGANVSFAANAGYTHSLQFANSLESGGQWSTLLTTNGSDATITVADPAEAPARFYRLALQDARWPAADPLVAINLGTLGASANGNYILVTHDVAGAIVGDSSNKAVRCSYELNGAHVSVPFRPELNISSAFTVEFWVKPGTTSTRSCPAASAKFVVAPGFGRGSGWYFYQTDSGFTSGNGFYLTCYNTTSDSASTTVQANMMLDTNQWYHIAGVYNGYSLNLYVNGANVSSAAMTTFRPNPDWPMMFGRRSENNVGYVGDLDEAAYYATALTPSQVLAHYQAGINAAPPIPYQQVILNDNPVGYWRFDEH